MTEKPRGLLIPFRRDLKRDFATGTGRELLASKVRQVLMTEGPTPRSQGELPWRPGAMLRLISTTPRTDLLRAPTCKLLWTSSLMICPAR